MATTWPKVTPSAPRPGMPVVRTAKSSWFGIDLNLHGAGKRHAVLLLVGCQNRVQLRLHVRKQLRGLCLVQFEDRRWVAEGVEVFIAVQQA